MGWKPTKLTDYSIPYACRDRVQEELRKLKDLGIIHESNSAYISPAFPVHKKDGSLRLVVYYRNLNQYTVKQHFPIPDLQECFHSLRYSRVFSSLDLNMGYYQIPVKESDRKYTSFVINGQQYEFSRIPFGSAMLRRRSNPLCRKC